MYMSDFRDTQIKALVDGILLDTCGLTTRDYSWGVYTDLCGMSYEDALKATQAPGNVAIGQLIINKCDCDCNCKCHDGSSTGSTINTGSTTTVQNIVYFTLNDDGELVLKFKEGTQGSVNLTFTMDGTPRTVSVPNGVVEYNTHYATVDTTKKYSEIKDVTYSADSANYKYTITNNVKDGYFLLTVKVDNQTIQSEKVKHDSAITLPDMTKVGYTFAWDNAVSAMPESDLTITGSHTVKTYKVTYTLKGYKEDVVIPETSVTFEQQITEPKGVEKEGYVLTWDRKFPVKPDDTVTEYSIEGTYAIQSYLLNIIAHFNKNRDEELIYSGYTEYDSAITLPDMSYDGYNFVEWQDSVLTMPAKELTITGVYELKTFKVNVPNVDGLAFTIVDKDGNSITPDKTGQITVEYGNNVIVTATAIEPNYIVGTSSFEEADTTINNRVDTAKTYNNAELVTSAEYVIDSTQEPESELTLDFTTNKYFTIDVKNEDTGITVEGDKFSIVPESAYTDADVYTETIKLNDDVVDGYDVVLKGTIGDKDINDFYDVDTNTLSIPLNTEEIKNGVDVTVSKKKKQFDVTVNESAPVTYEYGDEVELILTGDTEAQMAIDVDSVEGIPADAEFKDIVENDIVVSRKYKFIAKAPAVIKYATKPYYSVTINLDGMESDKENFYVYENENADVVLTPAEGKGWVSEISYTMGETTEVIADGADAKGTYTVTISAVTDNVTINAKAEVKKYNVSVTLADGYDASAVTFADNAIVKVESGATYTTTVSANGSNYLEYEILFDGIRIEDTTEYILQRKHIGTTNGSNVFITEVVFKIENVNKDIAIIITPKAYYSIKYNLGDGLSINNNINVISASELNTLSYIVSGTTSYVPNIVTVNGTEVWKRNDNDKYTFDESNLLSTTDTFGINNEYVKDNEISINASSSPVYAITIAAEGDTDMIDGYTVIIDGKETKSAKAIAGMPYSGSVTYDTQKVENINILKNGEVVSSIGGSVDSNIEYRVAVTAATYYLYVVLKTYDADGVLMNMNSGSTLYKYGASIGDIPATMVEQWAQVMKDQYTDKEFKPVTTTDTIPSIITGETTITYEMHENVVVTVSGAFMGVMKSTIDTNAISEDDILAMSNVNYTDGTEQKVTFIIPANANYQAQEDGFYDGSISAKNFRTWIKENDNYYLILSVPSGASFKLIGGDGVTDYAEQFTKLNTSSLSGNDYDVYGWSDTVDSTTVSKTNGISVATMGFADPTEKTYTMTITE